MISVSLFFSIRSFASPFLCSFTHLPFKGVYVVRGPVNKSKRIIFIWNKIYQMMSFQVYLKATYFSLKQRHSEVSVHFLSGIARVSSLVWSASSFLLWLQQRYDAPTWVPHDPCLWPSSFSSPAQWPLAMQWLSHYPTEIWVCWSLSISGLIL